MLRISKMTTLLYPNKYVKPGVYTRGLFGSETVTPLNRIQFPVVVGKGSRFIEGKEIISRGKVYGEQVSVSTTYPNIFHTKYPLILDKKGIVIYSDNDPIPNDYWTILNENTIQIINYDITATYFIDYQSSSKDTKDRTTLDIVSFNSVGDSLDSPKYVENKDFYLEYYFDNLSINKNPSESVLKFYPEYENEHDYPILKSYESTFNLEVSIRDGVSSNIDINGYVLRVDKKIVSGNEVINFIWLEFDYSVDGLASKKTNFKVLNDGNVHYWNNIGFKLTSETIVAKDTTKNGIYIESSETPDTFAVSVLGPKKLVQGPQRTISAKVIRKGEFTHEGVVENLVTICNPQAYYIDVRDTPAKNCSLKLTTEDIFIKDSTKYLVFVFSDDKGNTQYKEVPCYILHSNIELVDETVDFNVNGIVVTLYATGALALLTEDDRELLTEDDVILCIDSEESVYIPYRKKLMSFDYVRGYTYNPSIIEVSNTFSREMARVNIDSDEDYYSFNGILVKPEFEDFEEGDILSFDVKRTGFICWDLTEVIEEVNPAVCTDISGAITGTFYSKYIELANEYISNLSVVSDENFDYEVLIKGDKAYLVLTKNGFPYTPTRAFSIKYRTRTNQPDMSKDYYVSALCIRPESMYNTLIEVTSLDEGRNLLGPFDTFNDLYVANEIAWREFDIPRSYGYVQIKDSGNEGLLTDEDIKNALQGLVKSKLGTDIVLLRNSKYINDLLAFNTTENDPFEQNENKVWFDSVDVDFVSGVSNMQFANFKNAVATESAQIVIPVLGTDVTLNVDGSFVTWAIVCVRNSINYSDTILTNTINAFSSIKVYDEGTNLKFGSNNMIYITQDRRGNYVISEDVSLGGLEQVANQQVLSVRYVRYRMDETIGTNIESIADTINAIQAKLVNTLNEMIEQGYISNYLDEDGNKRPIEPDTDIFVKQVNGNQFQFGYGFYTKKGIKHLFGNYVIDRNFN